MLSRPWCRIFVALLFSAGTLSAQSPPPLLDIVRERIKPNSEAAYSRVEENGARVCARLCPNSYLALESMTKPREVLWLNQYATAADRDAVTQAYQRDTALMSELTKVLAPKKTLTLGSTTIATIYNAAASDGCVWRTDAVRFFVVAESRDGGGLAAGGGCVFEDGAGTRFILAPSSSRDEANRIAKRVGAGGRIFAVRRTWSNPSSAQSTGRPKRS